MVRQRKGRSGAFQGEAIRLLIRIVAPQPFAAYNGTLINITGKICFLTAGHVLADLKEKLDDDRIEVIDVVLADTFAKDRASDKPVPFDVRNEHFYIVDDEEQGLDFGAIPLRPYYTNLLAKNGTIALDEERWIHQHGVHFDGYAMLGLPQELTSPAVDASGNGAVFPDNVLGRASRDPTYRYPANDPPALCCRNSRGPIGHRHQRHERRAYIRLSDRG
ncbi:hypothetical protein ACFX5Q_22405 [Mesorhizobium sp. IMUNJ 23033]|uniref:hypothetical protein n=1 Tax=Mesorhizobium sp. IMUNJ 23033 TaxID=3378039 RepID=UPI00384D1699